MNNFIEAMTTKDARTNNGALTNSTSLNACLDFFSIAGSRKDLKESFYKAFGENPELAIRILFWSRDCRGGAGSRYNFILVMQSLQITYPKIFSKIFKFIPEYGYWKDLFKLRPTTEIIDFIVDTLNNENDHSLCAKYFPRKGVWFGLLRKKLGMSLSQFRHFIVNKTNVVEQYMCANKWSEIEYSSVPSVAGLRYANSFKNHDNERYSDFLSKVSEGKEKINASVLYPGDIFRQACPNYDIKTSNSELIRNLWNALPNYMQDCKERILPICDVSGSMYSGVGKTRPIDVSIGLGVYIAERNIGEFHNFFILFSEVPEFVYLSGDDVISHFEQVKLKDGLNTNLQRVFDLLLDRAKRFDLKQEDMPTKLLIISDMHFDQIQNSWRNPTPIENTNFEEIERKYKEAGYERPGIVFWNVNGDAGNIPVTLRDKNIALISGYSPAIIQSVMKGEFLNPIQVMLITVNSERYSKIKII